MSFSIKPVIVQIKYLVNLREHTGKSQEKISFPQGATLRDVAEWLNAHYNLSLPNPQIMAILNGKGWEQFPLKLDTKLQEEDVICLFPPVSGG